MGVAELPQGPEPGSSRSVSLWLSPSQGIIAPCGPEIIAAAAARVTGLGLDISWWIVVHRHHGDQATAPIPGNTSPEVRLPLMVQRIRIGGTGH